MKKLILIFSLISTTLQAQTVLFHENFDGPSGPDSVSTYNTSTSNNVLWNDTNQLYVSSPSSYHAKVVAYNSIIFETDPFSTLGKPFVILDFKHICKIYFLNQGKIEVSIDSGLTWLSVDSNHYKGDSPNFYILGYFFENSYPSPTKTPYWGGATITAPGITPTNAWWADEKFDISSLVGTVQSNGDTGYADVRVRFVLKHGGGFIKASGWYVDDLKVTGSTCEPEKPTVNWNIVPKFKPVGTRYGTYHAFRVEAKDNIGLDSALIYYSVNNGSWNVQKMIPLTTPSCNNTPTSIVFIDTIASLAINDTVDWYIEVYDCSCQNIKRDPEIINVPANYYTFWINPTLPQICGSYSANSFPHVISSFPWVEDFGSAAYWVSGNGTGITGILHRGSFPIGNPPIGQNWTVGPPQGQVGYAWSVRNYPTTTLNTGPLYDHTSTFGNYIYTEASQGTSGKSTQLITPCIDLSNQNCMGLEFYYHMYGANMGKLRVDIDTGTISSKWVKVFLLKGQQQSSASSPWKKAFVALDGYSGEIIKIRFVGVRQNGDLGDLAIDDVKVYKMPAKGAELIDFIAPINNLCSYSSNDSVVVKVLYSGCTHISKLPIAHELTNITTGTVTTTWDTIFYNFTPGKDTNYTFNVGANLSAAGKYSIKVFCSLAGDTDFSNDTVGPLYINHELPYSNFPYYSNFNESPWVAGNGSITNPGIYNTNLFKVTPKPTSGNTTWYVGKNYTPTGFTGPLNDRSLNGNYLYVEATSGFASSSVYTSRCLDFSNISNPTLSFWYHMYGVDINSIYIQLKKDGSDTWENVTGWNIQPPQQTYSKSLWLRKEIDLSTYSNKTVRLRILGKKKYGSTLSDMAIDDLAIYDKKIKDVGVTDVNPKNTISIPSINNPIVTLYNYGLNSVSNIPVAIEYIPICGGAPILYNSTYTGTIAPGTTKNFTFQNASNYPEGDFYIKAYSNLLNDSLNFNDTAYFKMVGRKVINISNGYSSDFDSCNSGLTEGFLNKGELNLFKLTQPSNSTTSPIDSSYSSPNCLLANMEDNSVEEIILLPVFNGLDSIGGGIELRFKYNYSFSNNSAGILEYYDLSAQNWKTLGSYGSGGSGCSPNYNSNNVVLLGGEPGWTGISQGWASACVSLDQFKNSSSNINLRFRLVANNTFYAKSLWAIDDIEIFISKQVDIGTGNITIETLPTVSSNGFSCSLDVMNYGYNDVNNFDLHYAIDGNFVDSLTVTPAQPIGLQDTSRTFFVVNSNISVGSHKICVWSQKPNGITDKTLNNDTTCFSFEVISNESFPYCYDFEANQVFLTQADFAQNTDSLWQYGTPNKTVISSAYSGSKCWVTDLTSNYKPNTKEFLYTKAFSIQLNKCYNFSIYHNYKTDNLFDGGNVEYTFDYGKTWQVLGDFTTLWYNQPYVFSLGINVPGFTGNSSGWIKSECFQKFNQSGEVILRFNFRSNNSIEDEGWAIDDFCGLELNISNCSSIGISENMYENGITLSPNPTSDFVTITRLNSKSELQVEILSTDGKVLLTTVFEKDNSELKIDLEGISDGIYLLKFSSGNEVVVKRFIVNK